MSKIWNIIKGVIKMEHPRHGHEKHGHEIPIDGVQFRQAYLILKRAIAILKGERGVSQGIIDRMEHVYVNLEDMQPPDRYDEHGDPVPGHVPHVVHVNRDRLTTCVENMHVVGTQLLHLKGHGHIRSGEPVIEQTMRDIKRIHDTLYKLLHPDSHEHQHGHEHGHSHGKHKRPSRE